MEPSDKSFAPVERQYLFAAQSRQQRQQKLDKLVGDLADLKREYEKQHGEAVRIREQRTKAREDLQRLEEAAVKEEGEEKAALDNYNAQVDKIRGAGGSAQKIAPDPAVAKPKGKH